eukprot:TRINITY_DN7497_c0_g2_i2.p1 TRINITY_DN7497_c0_g2~~TRINITY_DN7497_c0_g2_i2.p1  ORF type:complete len:533 (+),score=109.23 TRINITY_DN7497_c0_g2_i2:267-1865(+)
MSMAAQEPMDVLLEGYLVKSPPLSKSKKSHLRRWRQRYFVLWAQTKELEYFVDASMQERKGVIDINACYHINDDIPHQKYEHVFAVAVTGRKYYLVAGSARQRDEWVDMLREIVKKPASRLRRKPRSVTQHNFAEPVSTPPTGGISYQPPDTVDESMTRANTAPSIRSSTSSAILTADYGHVGQYLYPAHVHSDQVWLKLDYPNLMLHETLDQPPIMQWPIRFLRGYGQVGRQFQFEAGSKSAFPGIWNVELTNDQHNVVEDIDRLIRAETEATTFRPQQYVQLEFNTLGSSHTDQRRASDEAVASHDHLDAYGNSPGPAPGPEDLYVEVAERQPVRAPVDRADMYTQVTFGAPRQAVEESSSDDDDEDPEDYRFADNAEDDVDDYPPDVPSKRGSADSGRQRATSRPSVATLDSATVQMLTSPSVEYADISALKTLALQRAMEGMGTPPKGPGTSKGIRTRRTRHDVALEDRQQYVASTKAPEPVPEEDPYPSGSGAVDDLLKDIDDLYDQVEHARVKAYETVVLTDPPQS